MLTQEEAVRRIKVAHGDEYDLSIFVYRGRHHKSKVICKKCNNEWRVVFGSFINSKGRCPNCRKGKRLTQEEVVSKIEALSPGKYNFSKFVFVNISTKATLICNDCDTEWSATPRTLIHHKTGCP